MMTTALDKERKVFVQQKKPRDLDGRGGPRPCCVRKEVRKADAETVLQGTKETGCWNPSGQTGTIMHESTNRLVLMGYMRNLMVHAPEDVNVTEHLGETVPGRGK